jgi:hypothetical protein
MNTRTLLETITAVAMVVYVVRRLPWVSGRLKTARSRQYRDNAEVPAALANTMHRRFAEPTQCTYWHNPELVRAAPMKEGFELIETYADESHLRRYLLKCRECGQLYFFEFYEWVDWEHGNDPQYSKYIPVPTVEDAQMLKKVSQAELLLFSPALNIDFPRDAEAPTIYWAGKASS